MDVFIILLGQNIGKIAKINYKMSKRNFIKVEINEVGEE